MNRHLKKNVCLPQKRPARTIWLSGGYIEPEKFDKGTQSIDFWSALLYGPKGHDKIVKNDNIKYFVEKEVQTENIWFDNTQYQNVDSPVNCKSKNSEKKLERNRSKMTNEKTDKKTISKFESKNFENENLQKLQKRNHGGTFKIENKLSEKQENLTKENNMHISKFLDFGNIDNHSDTSFVNIELAEMSSIINNNISLKISNRFKSRKLVKGCPKCKDGCECKPWTANESFNDTDRQIIEENKGDCCGGSGSCEIDEKDDKNDIISIFDNKKQGGCSCGCCGDNDKDSDPSSGANKKEVGCCDGCCDGEGQCECGDSVCCQTPPMIG